MLQQYSDLTKATRSSIDDYLESAEYAEEVKRYSELGEETAWERWSLTHRDITVFDIKAPWDLQAMSAGLH